MIYILLLIDTGAYQFTKHFLYFIEWFYALSEAQRKERKDIGSECTSIQRLI